MARNRKTRLDNKIFGTDGIRGLVNKHPMDPESILKIGMAAGVFLQKGEHKHSVIIGKDTRISGYMLESALSCGFLAMGMDVMLVGPIPTPALSMLVSSMRGDLAVMISASHNPFYDNGIKLFAADGKKISAQDEMEITKIMQEETYTKYLSSSTRLGKAVRLDDAQGRYVEFVKSSFPQDLTLNGLKIIIDCANGGAYKIAPKVLWELGANVHAIADKPNGFNINKNCGALYPGSLVKAVKEIKPDIGLALDGDGDRLVIVDEKGNIITGDSILAVLSLEWQKNGKLRNDKIIGTLMSSLSLEDFIKEKGLEFIRTEVGDREISENMHRLNSNLGGEPSGHIIFSDYSFSGDGLITALQILAVLKRKGLKASEILHPYYPFPRIEKNIRCKNALTLENRELQSIFSAERKKLGDKAQLIVRLSGTEPIFRIVAEGENEELIKQAVENITLAIQEAERN